MSATDQQSSGNRVRQLRLAKGFTMTETAERAGISRAYLWQIETSDQEPGVDVARRLAGVLETTVDAIWGKPVPGADLVDDDSSRAKELIHQERNNNMPSQEIKDDLIWMFLNWSAIQKQTSSRFAELSKPILEYETREGGIVDQLAEILGKWDKDEIAQSLLTATESQSAGKYDVAIQFFNRAQQLTDDLGLIAMIDWHLGSAYMELPKYGRAIECYEQALYRLKDRIAQEDVAGMVTSLGWLCYRAGKYTKAEFYFKDAMERWEHLKGSRQEFKTRPDENYQAARRGLGSVRERQGDLSSAIESLSDIAIDDLLELAWAESRLGFLHIHTGQWDLAKEKMEAGVKLCTDASIARDTLRQRSQKKLQELILNNQGLLLFRKGDYNEALRHSEEALGRAEAIDDHRGEAFCHLFAAFIHEALGQYELALDHVMLSDRLFRRMDILYYLPELLCLQADLFLERAGEKSAERAVREALDLTVAPDSKSIYQEGIVLRSLGKVQVKQMNWSAAERSFSRSVDLLRQVGDPFELALSQVVWASAILDVGTDQLRTAVSFLEEAKDAAQKLGANGLLERIAALGSRLPESGG